MKTNLVRSQSSPLDVASGVLLVALAALAMLWANSPASAAYFALRELSLHVAIGGHVLARSFEWVVNDILMTIFFFVVGMEIRREIHHGELSAWRRAALPIAAALGGMLAPAGLYLAIAGAPSTARGWGVPMATDIAFALGVLALLGGRVPPALRVLLLALAVIDDLGAILVIALFYSDGIQLAALGVAGLGITGSYGFQALGVRSPWLYVLPGIVVWLGIYNAGLHPTIAGVVIGMITPVRVLHGQDLDSLAERLIHALHPWVAYAIMPIFALTNAGVAIGSVALEGDARSVALGVAAGLLLGKPIGVLLLASLLVVKLGLATLPQGIGLRALIVLGFVAGIGFTMALFIAQLAFAGRCSRRPSSRCWRRAARPLCSAWSPASRCCKARAQLRVRSISVAQIEWIERCSWSRCSSGRPGLSTGRLDLWRRAAGRLARGSWSLRRQRAPLLLNESHRGLRLRLWRGLRRWRA